MILFTKNVSSTDNEECSFIKKLDESSFEVTNRSKMYEAIESFFQSVFEEAPVTGLKDNPFATLLTLGTEKISLKKVLKKEFNPQAGEFYIDSLHGRIINMTVSWKNGIVTITKLPN